MKNSIILGDGFLQRVIDSSPDGIIIFDAEGHVILFNPVARKIFEPFGEISQGKQISSINKKVWEALEEILSTGSGQHRNLFDLNHRIYVASLSIIRALKECVGVLCIFQDISELKNISYEFSCFPQSLEEVEAIINSSYDGIHVIDAQGKVVRVNPSWERITGLNRKDVVGKNVHDLMKEGYYSNSVAAMVLKKKKQVTLRGEVLKTGKKVLVSGNPIFDRHGKLIMVVNNVRDLTIIQKLSEEIQRSRNLTNEYQQKIQIIKKQSFKHEDIVFQSNHMKEVMELAAQVAMTDAPTLITGETGVGKELVAEFIHKQSERSSRGVLLKINCGAIPENLLEAELFGYEGGSFTGANSKGKPGLFESADEGTLMLDEIGELPPKMQVKLLRVIQDLEITRIGGVKPKKINVHLISLTNTDLARMVENGTFRKDLYFRLLVFHIQVPPLRERRDDILCLINHFLDKFNAKYGKDIHFSKAVTDNLINYNWPGNVRELKHLVERLVVISPKKEVVNEDLVGELDERSISCPFIESGSYKNAVHSFELRLIKSAIEKHGGVRQAAYSLKINPATIYRKLKVV